MINSCGDADLGIEEEKSWASQGHAYSAICERARYLPKAKNVTAHSSRTETIDLISVFEA